MATAGRTLTVYLAADTKNAAKEMDTFAGKMKSVVGPAFLGAAAAAGAFAIKLGVDAVQGAIAEQAEVDKLNKILENNGFKTAAADVDVFISKQAALTTFTDSDLRPAFEKLFLATGSVDQAQKLLIATMDVAIGSGNSLESTTKAMSKAADGNVAMLNKLIPGLETTKDKTSILSDVTGELADKFGGSATRAAQTWQGQLGNVRDAFGELQDSFGKGFLDGMAAAQGGMGNLTQSMLDAQPVFQDLGRRIGEVVAALVKVAGWFTTVNDKLTTFRDSLGDSAWGDAIDTFRRFMTGSIFGIFDLLISKIDSAWNALQRLMSALNGNIAKAVTGGLGTSRSLSMSSGTASKSMAAATPNYNITVNAGVGNPVEIARAIENTLRIRNTRLGTI